ncbi:hypothetical protein [Sphingopyxis sp. H115]|uniref:hypothetical protein n=1 Tax=Sphingopyxis sp. H115 TaxID=1759073 RepID=UPI000AC30B33|nr:hypothetical protein [Sphingopyxis sp. H115]
MIAPRRSRRGGAISHPLVQLYDRPVAGDYMIVHAHGSEASIANKPECRWRASRYCYCELLSKKGGFSSFWRLFR